MVLNNTDLDPYTADRGYYECHACGSRTTSEQHVGACPDCGGTVRNIAVARE